jgi:NAD(P) transhydrogenase subunit alpha
VIVGVPKETAAGERRVALVPDAVKPLKAKGIELLVQAGAGEAAGFADAAYTQAGAALEPTSALIARAELIVKVQGPRALADGGHEADLLREGQTLVGALRPLDQPELAARLAQRRVTAFALELMPRITRAQSMDILSSMATIAGYRAVLLAATALPKIFPLLVTAAGTVSPARVLVIGAGVAGLQAIATARRLGGVVEAYDTRPAVKEQVQSLGAKFVELPLETKDAEDAGGYARAQSEEFYARQRELLGERVRASDVVITTAQVPGARAPVLIDEATVGGMRGSVIVDLRPRRATARSRAPATIGRTGYDPGPSILPTHARTPNSYSRNVKTFWCTARGESGIVSRTVTRTAAATSQVMRGVQARLAKNLMDTNALLQIHLVAGFVSYQVIRSAALLPAAGIAMRHSASHWWDRS